MHTFRFRKFPVYQDALMFRKEIRTLTNDFFPKREMYSLTDQLLRASNSIILNIAEGTDRSTDKDFAHFLNTSYASLNEVVACFDIALLDGYITDTLHNDHLEKASKLAAQLAAFRNKLLHEPTK